MSDAPSAVMASRAGAADSLDLFPTPPWATRALLEEVLLPRGWMHRDMRCWDPCCGKGHMTLPLRGYFADVFASDVFDWGFGDRRELDFSFAKADDAPGPVDWVIMNPPFVIAEAMLTPALALAREGVAMLLRLAWLEGAERHRLVFSGQSCPKLVCPFAERVAMIEGAWDPDASSATAYAWFVWRKAGPAVDLTCQHIRPGAAARYTRMTDRALATPGEAARRLRERKARAGKNSVGNKAERGGEALDLTAMGAAGGVGHRLDAPGAGGNPGVEKGQELQVVRPDSLVDDLFDRLGVEDQAATLFRADEPPELDGEGVVVLGQGGRTAKQECDQDHAHGRHASRASRK